MEELEIHHFDHLTGAYLDSKNVSYHGNLSTGLHAVWCNVTVMGCSQYGPYPNQLFIVIFFCSMAVVGSIANIMVLVGVVAFKLLKKPASHYVATMVVADLFLCGAYAPYCVVTVLESTRVGCEVMGIAMMLALYVSYLSLVSVAINRYLLVALPQARYDLIYNGPGTVISLLMIWAVAVLCTIPLLLGEGEVGVDKRLGVCTVSLSNQNSFVLEVLISMALGVPCVVIIIGCYVGVWRRFRRSVRAVNHRAEPSSRGGREGWRLSVNLFIITMVTCVCWTPSTVLVFIDHDIQADDILYQLIILLSLTHSFINPVLHLVLNSNATKVYHVATRRLSLYTRNSTRVEALNM